MILGALLKPDDFLFCMNQIGTTRGFLAQFAYLWAEFLKSGVAKDQVVRFTLMRLSAELGNCDAASMNEGRRER